MVIPLFLGACAGTAQRKMSSAPDRPEWIEKSPAEFPAARYLTGSGSGPDLESARDAARVEIAKVFSSRISAANFSSVSERTFSGESGAQTTAYREAAATVHVATEKVMAGVEVSRSWRDPGGGRYYALAVLDKSKVRAALSDRLAELDEQVGATFREMATTTDKLARARTALKVRAFLKSREAPASDLRVLSHGADVEPPYDLNSVRSAIEKALTALDVALTLRPVPRERVLAEIRKALNALGVEPGGNGGDLVVNCEASFESMEDPDPKSRWKWWCGSGTATLVDARNGREILSAAANSKEAAASESEALAKAESSLGKKLGAAITRGIADFLERP